MADNKPGNALWLKALLTARDYFDLCTLRATRFLQWPSFQYARMQRHCEIKRFLDLLRVVAIGNFLWFLLLHFTGWLKNLTVQIRTFAPILQPYQVLVGILIALLAGAVTLAQAVVIITMAKGFYDFTNGSYESVLEKATTSH